MNVKGTLAGILLATTVLGTAAYAADQTAQPPKTQAMASQRAADHDIDRMSQEGAQAFGNIQAARVALFNEDPAAAKTLVEQAQAQLRKAKADDIAFTKAEADLKQPAGLPAPQTKGDGTQTASTEAVAWLPIGSQLTLGEDFVATPEKVAAVAKANQNLGQGDTKAAVETLKLSDVNAQFVLAVVPLDQTTADVDQAAKLIGSQDYYKANSALKKATDGLRFDVADAVGVPEAVKTAKTADNVQPPAKTAPQAAAPAPKTDG